MEPTLYSAAVTQAAAKLRALLADNRAKERATAAYTNALRETAGDRPFVVGFRLHLRHGESLHGALFPDGRCLVVEDIEAGLITAAPSLDDLIRGYPDARIEWPAQSPGLLEQQYEDIERLQGYLNAVCRVFSPRIGAWAALAPAVQDVITARDQATAAVARVRAWCGDLDRAVRLRHGDPHAEHPHAVALRLLLDPQGGGQ
ncbi:hypothetical protein ACFY84_29915 [Streptomyces sp. NPDC012438]|uniref:hypothetical protein n=1 Tax=Streptomyces sp. NPDC012438 TaxID=3364833 RepID=UPI0036E034CB